MYDLWLKCDLCYALLDPGARGGEGGHPAGPAAPHLRRQADERREVGQGLQRGGRFGAAFGAGAARRLPLLRCYTWCWRCVAAAAAENVVASRGRGSGRRCFAAATAEQLLLRAGHGAGEGGACGCAAQRQLLLLLRASCREQICGERLDPTSPAGGGGAGAAKGTALSADEMAVAPQHCQRRLLLSKPTRCEGRAASQTASSGRS
eukprot:10210-Chlamydomonas_euryale.AAC.3